ncbi:hypothetical protein LEP1GSC043_0050 [Leptospira weilii str. Ecochallenge]|uniref:Membrane-bound O-acyltransferase family MBOAT domain protein n=1 Tax=Leptospira weilii str. Ecochallenge TaxID=1049986 RepID=N1UKD9_9LEPT|nr:hypothetical protein LEP1GSC043_0050 [Leptospira weilii str. Ecochallenge]
MVSYCFYLSWDYRFGALILFTTVLDYSVGRALSFQKNLRKRKVLLFLSLLGNLSVLVFFKYFHFFMNSFLTLFHSFGWQISAPTLKVILPVGISFYTFQSLSYSIDVYRQRIQPEKIFSIMPYFCPSFLNSLRVRLFPRKPFCLRYVICLAGMMFLFGKGFG